MTATEKAEAHDLEPVEALARGEVKALVAVVPENERPLSGLAGLLDWRAHGGISAFLKRSSIRGTKGECAYFPFARGGKVWRLILVGGGPNARPGARLALAPESMHSLRKNLISLNLGNVGVSRRDLGFESADALGKVLRGTGCWILN